MEAGRGCQRDPDGVSALITMPNYIQLVLSLFFLAMVCACSNRHAPTLQHPILGNYSLRAHDNSGQLVFTGAIRLETIEQKYLKGYCTIVKEKNAPERVFDNSGKCEAVLEGNAVNFDLAPMMDDGGMLLEGEWAERKIMGVWRLDGFVASAPLGPFEALKID